ncbi:ParB/RepB/Spo0J family partition protein [Candidatus Uhrbacteria bacterium]|nr:ParB/RepB/Spo0J family partition protein [Candidatus Uhrbacteria bacterium]
MSSRGLGRGLSALIPGAPLPVSAADAVTEERQTVHAVSPDRIIPNPRQPRRVFPEAELEALAASIRTHGILQPLVVTARANDTFELIAGERRLRAAKRAGLSTVPVLVREEPDAQRKLELALIENVQRQDLDPIDRALAFRDLVEEFGLTQEDVATRVGISRTAVAHSVRLLVLPADIQEALRVGKLSEGHAKVLAGMTNPAEQRAWFVRICEERLPVAAVAAATAEVERTRPQRMRVPIDPNLHAKELALQQRLGARVRIRPQGAGGRIGIEYHDAEELSGIVQRIVRES